MRAAEFIDHQLDENWKKAITGLAGAGALALGAQTALQHQNNSDVQRMEIPRERIATADFNKIKTALSTPQAKMLVSVARNAGLKNEELAQFLAQCAHETLNFSRLKEFGGRLDFKKYDIKHNPKKAKILGNTEVGDGQKYIGRGFIQITGKDNYQRAGQALNLPLVDNPELAERPDIAAQIAVWFWKNRVASKVTDFSNTEAATKPINSGLRGLDDRHQKFVIISRMLGLN